MRLADFDFELPEDRIALRPASPRDGARLLEVGAAGDLADRGVSDLPGRLRPGDALVFNDTRVIAARLTGRRFREGLSAAIEATLHRRLAPARWSAFMRPGKRLQPGDGIIFAASGTDQSSALRATVVEKNDGGEVTLDFALEGAALDAAIALHGAMPLPPYIAARRPGDAQDALDYQTIYARETGSVAAPTAGLHFTERLIAGLADRGVSTHFVTLHVGAGTFLPVKTQVVADHRMHPEFGEVTPKVAAALNQVRADGGRIVCVGTTSLRLLESAATPLGEIRAFADETGIFITPGYRFRVADALMTNFHLPRSTLFMLVCAFSGHEVMRRAYAHAIAGGYRFYSYGDASLLWRSSQMAS